MTSSNGCRFWCFLRRLLAQLRVLRDEKAVLEAQEIIAEALEGCVVLFLVTAPMEVLPQKIEHGCERAEEVVPTDVKF